MPTPRKYPVGYYRLKGGRCDLVRVYFQDDSYGPIRVQDFFGNHCEIARADFAGAEPTAFHPRPKELWERTATGRHVNPHCDDQKYLRRKAPTIAERFELFLQKLIEFGDLTINLRGYYHGSTEHLADNLPYKMASRLEVILDPKRRKSRPLARCSGSSSRQTRRVDCQERPLP